MLLLIASTVFPWALSAAACPVLSVLARDDDQDGGTPDSPQSGDWVIAVVVVIVVVIVAVVTTIVWVNIRNRRRRKERAQRAIARSTRQRRPRQAPRSKSSVSSTSSERSVVLESMLAEESKQPRRPTLNDPKPLAPNLAQDINRDSPQR